MEATIQHYTYDHNGIRILKTSVREVGVAQEGNPSTQVVMDPYTVYVNPYFVATHYASEVEASKHYYMGAQRIATGLINYPFVGEDDTNDPDPEPGGGQPESGNNTSYGATINLQAVLLAFGKTNGVDYQINDLLTMPVITNFSYDDQTAFDDAVDNANEDENRVTPCEEDPLCLCELSRHWAWVTYGIDCSDQRVMYWYHPDYLGNTEFITDLNGDPYQFFLYSPWGESLESHHKHSNQMAFAYDSPYRFNAKELDAETGNYYYGARYYDPKVSVWLSVDPLASSSANITPYHFVSNNPIMRIDPNGLTDYELNQQSGQISMVPGTETKSGPDRLIAGTATYDNRGNLTSTNYQSVKKGVIDVKNLSMNVPDPDGVDEIGNPRATMQVTELDASDMGPQGANDLFEFIADNTDVEYSLTEMRSKKDNKYVISSSHGDQVEIDCTVSRSEESAGRIISRYSSQGYSLTRHTHSHPGFVGYTPGSPRSQLTPSAADLQFAGAASGATYYIYSRVYGARQQYNGQGPVGGIRFRK